MLYDNQSTDNDHEFRLVELLYIYADSACDILNSHTHPDSKICYSFLHKLHRRGSNIDNRFHNLAARANDLNRISFSYFDNVNFAQPRHLPGLRAPGGASLYNN